MGGRSDSNVDARVLVARVMARYRWFRGREGARQAEWDVGIDRATFASIRRKTARNLR